jgi:hypothetical protein
MRRRVVSTVRAGTAAIVILLVCFVAGAESKTISGMATPCCSACWPNCCPCPTVSMPQGCTPTTSSYALLPPEMTGASPHTAGNFNVLPNESGILFNVLLDDNGSAVVTEAVVQWQADLSSSSGDTIKFTGPDLKLMAGYLESGPLNTSTTIQISGIPADLAASYYVVVYTLTNVPTSPMVGGDYTVSTSNGFSDTKHVLADGTQTGYTGPDFVQVPNGMDPAFGPDDWGNYVVFTGPDGQALSGTSVTITATPINFPQGRAPINGFQIVSVP